MALGGGQTRIYMASVKQKRKAKASSLAEVGHASTSVSHAWRGVHGGLVVSSSQPSEGFGGFVTP